MDVETWIKLLGKSQDDKGVAAALAAAGVKKIPKLKKEHLKVFFDLKGEGMGLEMTDEAYFKHLDDQDIGEGPLILTEVGAYLDKSMSRDLYEGALPFKLAVGMTQADLRKTLGKPARSGDAPLFDIWPRDGLEVTARYTKDLKFAYFAVKLLRPRSCPRADEE